MSGSLLSFPTFRTYGCRRARNLWCLLFSAVSLLFHYSRGKSRGTPQTLSRIAISFLFSTREWQWNYFLCGKNLSRAESFVPFLSLLRFFLLLHRLKLPPQSQHKRRRRTEMFSVFYTQNKFRQTRIDNSTQKNITLGLTANELNQMQLCRKLGTWL